MTATTAEDEVQMLMSNPAAGLALLMFQNLLISTPEELFNPFGNEEDQNTEEFVPEIDRIIMRQQPLEIDPPLPTQFQPDVCRVITEEKFREVITRLTITSDDNDCAICMSGLVKEAVGFPVCGHKFHEECLKEWLTMNAITCPVCRQPAVSGEGEYTILDPPPVIDFLGGDERVVRRRPRPPPVTGLGSILRMALNRL